jgi:hypothetical protein
MVPYRVTYMTYLIIGGAILLALASKSILGLAAGGLGAYYALRVLAGN